MRACQCPNCGANFTFEDDSKDFCFCQYCGTKITFDDYRSTHRFVDEAELKRAEYEREIRMRELDLEEREQKIRLQEAELNHSVRLQEIKNNTNDRRNRIIRRIITFFVRLFSYALSAFLILFGLMAIYAEAEEFSVAALIGCGIAWFTYNSSHKKNKDE